jgi:HlyD family secretion protein
MHAMAFHLCNAAGSGSGGWRGVRGGVLAGGLACAARRWMRCSSSQAPLVRTLQFSARVATLSRVDVGSTITGRVARCWWPRAPRCAGAMCCCSWSPTNCAPRWRRPWPLSSRPPRAGRPAQHRAFRPPAPALAQADATVRAAQAEPAGAATGGAGLCERLALDDARRAVEVAQAQQQAARAQPRPTPTGTDLVQAQAQLALAQAATQSARARLAQATVLARRRARAGARGGARADRAARQALLSWRWPARCSWWRRWTSATWTSCSPARPPGVVADAFAGQRFAARVLSIAPAVDAQRGAVE